MSCLSTPEGQIPESVADGGSSRREFLRATTSLGGGLLLSFALPTFTRNAKAADTVGAEGFAPNGFVRVKRDGRVILTMPQVEMGQGTYTSMSMLIAEELEVGIDQIHLEPAPPDDKVYANSVFAGIQVTGGSTSVRRSGSHCAALAPPLASCWSPPRRRRRGG